MKALINLVLICILTFSILKPSKTQNAISLSLVSESIIEKKYTWGDKYVELKTVDGKSVGSETYKKYYYLKYQKKYFVQTEIIWISGDTIKFGPYGETFVSSDENTILKYGYFKGDSLNDFSIFFYNHAGELQREISKYYKKQPTIYMADNGKVGVFGEINGDNELYKKTITIYDKTGATEYEKLIDTLNQINDFKISKSLKMYAYDFDLYDASGNLFSKGIKIKETPEKSVLDLEFNYDASVEYYQFFDDDYFILKTSNLLALYSFPLNQIWSFKDKYTNAERFCLIKNKDIFIVLCTERLSLSQWDTNYTVYLLDVNSGEELASYKLENKGPIFDSDEVFSIIDEYNFNVQIHNEIFSFKITY